MKPRAKRELAAVTFTGDTSTMENSPIWKNGKIHTGYYANWRQLSKQDRDAVLAERDKQGKPPSKGNKSGKSNKTWKKQVKGLKKKIAALKRKVPGSDESDDDTVDEPTNDAGNSFGGRSEKAKKKRNN